MFHILYKYFAKLGLVKHYKANHVFLQHYLRGKKKVEMDF